METIYEKLTLKMVEDALFELAETKVNKRTFRLGTGKAGILSYLKIFYEQCGLSEDEIKIKITKATKELQEGSYIITEQGITYNGKTINYG
jgi:hypothetical protein